MYQINITVKEKGTRITYSNLIEAESASMARTETRALYLLPPTYPVKVRKAHEKVP